jgi:hypothetical protein
MIRIKNYDSWLSESQEIENANLITEGRLSPAEFIESMREAMDKAGLSYTVFSTKTQLKNGTLIVEIGASDYLRAKAKEFNLENRVLASYNVYLNEKERLQIYAKGSIRIPTGSSDFFKFSPTLEEVNKVPDYLKTRFLKHFLDKVSTHLNSFLVPDTIKVSKKLKGYEISQKTMDLIIATVNDKILERRSRQIMSLEPEIRNSFSPLIMMGYFMKEAGMNISFSTNDYQDFRNLTLNIYVGNRQWPDNVTISARSKFKLKSDLSSLEINKTVDMMGYFYGARVHINDYDKVYSESPEDIKPFVKLSMDPALGKKLEEIAVKKKGFIVGKQFGF